MIKWPTGREAEEVMRGFRAFRGMENVIGAIDGSHIPIMGQGEETKSYINRKDFPSIVLQAVCDHKLKFTNCFIGFPGAVHDARIFVNSPIYKDIMNKPIEMLPRDSFLIGDAAYGLETFLITPFKGLELGARSSESNFNFVHASTRNVIERAFGVMKGRFRRLTEKIQITDPEEICKLTMVACILHNFCLLEEERLFTDADDSDDDTETFEELDVNDDKALEVRRNRKRKIEDIEPCLVTYGSDKKSAKRKRNEIVKKLENRKKRNN
ncbi:putative nuclease HARBI1 [Clytia hemisphaerica]|uniref:putative nuclease HARBI1 n=1 Tax=Clytia hemisphaerica TaxID=252671 RepID=UPI0034D58FEA